ncbi:hypothetical protein [Leptolyngbya sp. FACHB-261]|uniref:hypothetical protein n=1 Tax=Leptolyngbya sp. FACHB-261 TaxID=2692806 RepID=UPI0016827C7D|nr:hypothetical protein [Leptolyngbya sp. FACHB-261]MBD2100000.1 hypothetical protein [Leptolyngbya sp. FACHB-261]
MNGNPPDDRVNRLIDAVAQLVEATRSNTNAIERLTEISNRHEADNTRHERDIAALRAEDETRRRDIEATDGWGC